VERDPEFPDIEENWRILEEMQRQRSFLDAHVTGRLETGRTGQPRTLPERAGSSGLQQELDEHDHSRFDAEAKRWSADPVAWAKERCGITLWEKQREIAESLRDSHQTVVYTCHTIGKSLVAAVLTCWWLASHPIGSAFVVTTAPSDAQVKAILWREINRLHSAAELPGRTNLSEWYIDGELVALGRKPADYRSEAFVGIHAPYVLMIIDEGCGVRQSLWDAASTLVSNPGSKILAIGNPDVPGGPFQRAALDPGWVAIQVGYGDVVAAIESGDVSEELATALISEAWVEDRRRVWGEGSALFQSKCLGQFPTGDDSPWVVVPSAWSLTCRNLELPLEGTVEAGIDVGAGGDRTVVWVRQGNVALAEHVFRSPDPMATVAEIARFLNEHGVQRVKVDSIGIGWGVAGRLRELSSRHATTLVERQAATHHAEVVPVNVARASLYPSRFLNLRAELWWEARERSRLQSWDLTRCDDDLLGELAAPRYEILDSRGKVKIEAKADVIARLGVSPDRADALLLAFHEAGSEVTTAAVHTFRQASLGLPSGSSPFGSDARREGAPLPPGAPVYADSPSSSLLGR
jgi:hypothetical protein